MEQVVKWGYEGLTRSKQAVGYLWWYVGHYLHNRGCLYKLEHVLVAEQALGHALPPGAVVHHIDEDRANNRNNNLVICQNRQYHEILHRRMEALRASGHAHYRYCRLCRQWDDPVNLYIREEGDHRPGERKRGMVWHRTCHAEYERQRRQRQGNR